MYDEPTASHNQVTKASTNTAPQDAFEQEQTINNKSHRFVAITLTCRHAYVLP